MTPIREKEKSFERIQFFHIFVPLTLDPYGAFTWDRKVFSIPWHHISLIPFSITTINFLILCAILLCSVYHILIHKFKKSHFDFQPAK